MDCDRERMLITREKRDFYVADIAQMMGEHALEQKGGIKVKADQLNGIIHKLLHAATCNVFGRQCVHHLLRCLRHANRERRPSILIRDPLQYYEAAFITGSGMKENDKPKACWKFDVTALIKLWMISFSSRIPRCGYVPAERAFNATQSESSPRGGWRLVSARRGFNRVVESSHSPTLLLSPRGFHPKGGISGLCPRRAREESGSDRPPREAVVRLSRCAHRQTPPL
jgi:hypothetical protein